MASLGVSFAPIGVPCTVVGVYLPHREIREDMIMSVDRLLTMEELAELLRRPVATIRYWRYLGTGPRGANVAGRVMYRESDVERWIAEQFDNDETVADRRAAAGV
jgi:predicted DNA-binding transcriptional regulator AlpA